MRNSMLIAAAPVVALSLLVSGCGTKRDETPPVHSHFVMFNALDHNGAGLPGVSVYLDAGTAPVGTTDAAGAYTYPDLTGVHSVHFVKAGYTTHSYVNRDWTDVSGKQVPQMLAYPGGTASSTVSGTIGNTQAGDQIWVVARRQSDAQSTYRAPVSASGTTAAYPANGAMEGTNDLIFYPYGVGYDAGSSFVAYSRDVPVSSASPVTLNPTLTRGAATSFSVAADGGFVGGSIQAGYMVAGDPYLFGWFMLRSTSASAGDSLAATTVNIPPIDQVFPAATYGLRVMAYRDPSQAANYEARLETRVFPSYAELSAAATPQSFTFTNDSVVPATPAHGATDTGVSPAFSWSLAGNPDRMDLVVHEYETGRGYARRVWNAQIWGPSSTVTPPAVAELQPDTAYSYNLYARRTLYSGTGAYAGFQRNGWEVVKFSTGATPPP